MLQGTRPSILTPAPSPPPFHPPTPPSHCQGPKSALISTALPISVAMWSHTGLHFHYSARNQNVTSRTCTFVPTMLCYYIAGRGGLEDEEAKCKAEASSSTVWLQLASSILLDSVLCLFCTEYKWVLL